MTLVFPREHGAWGILLVPFLTAAAVAGVFDAAVVVALTAVVCAFLARTPLEFLLAPASRRLHPAVTRETALRSVALFGTGAFAAGAALALHWNLLRWLLPLAGLAFSLFLLHLERWRRGRGNGWAAALLGAVALTLGAPAAWIAATGGLNATGLLVWLLNAAFFSAGVIYVRSRIRALAARTPSTPSARLVWGYHAGVVTFVAVLVLLRWVPPLAILPFALATGRAAWGARQFGQRFALRQLGWTEVAHSLVFALLLVAAFRL